MENNEKIFPPPPEYYKEFTSPNKYEPPKLSLLKIDEFVSFGNKYYMNELNISYNPVNIKDIKQKLSKETTNNQFFNKIQNSNPLNINCEHLNVIESLEKEIIFLRTSYKNLLQGISNNINFGPNRVQLIGLSLQKIHFYLIALRKKAILQRTINFYLKGIQDCEETSKQVDEAKKDLRNYLEEGLRQFK